MAWTQTELDALKKAYAAGTTSVTYDGKTVEYDSERGLLRRIRTIEAEMAATAGKPKPSAVYASFSRGSR